MAPRTSQGTQRSRESPLSQRRRSEADPRRRLLRSISEAEFQRTVVAKAEAWGWWWWHDTDSRKNRRGLPDLILVRPPRVLFVELKREGEKPTVEQQGVLDMLARCPGVEVDWWQPSDERALDDVLRPG